MSFTGDLEHLHIVDIIQLLHTTRKSGTFSVRGAKGESRIVFDSGYIVSASHLDNKVRIGTVLVRLNVITGEDLKEALQAQKAAGRARKPLLATLIGMGKLRQEDASRGLRKLIELTIVELIGWSGGTFTLDTEDIAVSPECRYPIGRMEQETSLDAQMVLMDALRVFDERERDRQAGKEVPPYEELFAEVLPSAKEAMAGRASVTADDLGLGDLEQLERKLPEAPAVNEIFRPIDIHRQKIRETLAGIAPEEQEAFISFLGRYAAPRGGHGGAGHKEEQTKALVLFSEDELIKHTVMTICKNDGILVFATDGEEELDRIVAQCFAMKSAPVVVFDFPEAPEGPASAEKIVSLRRRVTSKYPQVSTIQLASSPEQTEVLEAYREGVTAVFPKGRGDGQSKGFIPERIRLLEALTSYISRMFRERKEPASSGHIAGLLRERLLAFRSAPGPSDLALSLLKGVSEVFERSLTFVVRSGELIGERAIGVFASHSSGPTPAKVRVPLTGPSLFLDVVEKGRPFCGEAGNDVSLKEQLYRVIGPPRSPQILLLPLRSQGRVMALIYADFGQREASEMHQDLMALLGEQAGLALENILCLRIPGKTG